MPNVLGCNTHFYIHGVLVSLLYSSRKSFTDWTFFSQNIVWESLFVTVCGLPFNEDVLRTQCTVMDRSVKCALLSVTGQNTVAPLVASRQASDASLASSTVACH